MLDHDKEIENARHTRHVHPGRMYYPLVYRRYDRKIKKYSIRVDSWALILFLLQLEAAQLAADRDTSAGAAFTGINFRT